MQLEQGRGENLSFELRESELFSSSVFGEGSAGSVDYGQQCDSTIGACDAFMYDIDEDCFVGNGDLACVAGCWRLCRDDPGYANSSRVIVSGQS